MVEDLHKMKKTGRRKIFDKEGHAHFITFSCYRRRKLLNHNRAKRIVIHYLAAQLKNQCGRCFGFVVMPDHVHALVHFDENKLLSVFVSQWKRRSSIELKQLYGKHLTSYASRIDLKGPIWQSKYYDFNIYSENKALEKLDYMHNNPVMAMLVNRPEDWLFGSARWYMMSEFVGVPIMGLGFGEVDKLMIATPP